MAKRNPKNKPENIEYSVGSGNVYADFGVTVHIPPPSSGVCKKNDSQINFYFFLMFVLLTCQAWIQK